MKSEKKTLVLKYLNANQVQQLGSQAIVQAEAEVLSAHLSLIRAQQSLQALQEELQSLSVTENLSLPDKPE